MAKVDSRSCPEATILSVAFPTRLSTMWPAPKRSPVRTTVESTFWPSSVPSITVGGSRHTSQLPHGSVASPK
jgi:hypothetical protein